MTRQPVPLHQQVASMIKAATKTVALHTQQITTLQSRVAAVGSLQPAPFAAVTLMNGWTNADGFVPAQTRLLTSTSVHVIGNITGGATADGTVIGMLAAGHYNTVHAHVIDAIAVAGAQAVPTAGAMNNSAVHGAVMSVSMVPAADHSVSVPVPTTQIPSASHSFSAFPVTFGPGGYQFQNQPPGTGGNFTLGPSGTQFQNIPNNTPTADTTVKDPSVNTPINMNKPSITIGTDGSLTINNVNPAVTHLSFHEPGLPLYTA